MQPKQTGDVCVIAVKVPRETYLQWQKLIPRNQRGHKLRNNIERHIAAAARKQERQAVKGGGE
jgi:uncharacterized protein YjcR